ncbi:MAG: endolytic transglycosylase MltG [Herpetosiphonaceae bacterium]|nr:endolytic transglycosylase MltG [Herpetosiphonaceae bacterium]
MVLVVLGSLVVAGVATLVINEIKSSADTTSTDVADFVIDPGDTAGQIATKLKDQGLIKQTLLFNLMVRERKVAGKLQAGQYQLEKSWTTGQIITALQKSRVEEKKLTVIPGSRIEEIAKVLVDAKLAPSTDAALATMKNADYFKKAHPLLKDIPAGQSLEGYLFPDTYQVVATAKITDVVDTMLKGFEDQYKTFDGQILVKGRSTHDIVTMASIIQREAASDAEMPHVAYILWNRLDPRYAAEVAGRLQADPTVQYAAGYDTATQTWWRKNIDQFIDINSPYNTRKNQGLPPGPIDSPALTALKAAARPGADRPDASPGDKDLYFVAKCGTNGTNYAATLQEFNKLQAEYLSCPNPR